MSQGANKKQKFNPEKFRGLMRKKLEENNIETIDAFARKFGIPKLALHRAMTGVVFPKLSSLNLWASFLKCTSEERAALIASVYVPQVETPSAQQIPAA